LIWIKPVGHVRFGSKADICGAPAHVRYGPKADIRIGGSTEIPPLLDHLVSTGEQRYHHLDRPTSFKMLHTTSSGQCTGKVSKGALVNGVSVIILGVTVIFRVLRSPNEYLLSTVPNNIDPSELISLFSQ